MKERFKHLTHDRIVKQSFFISLFLLVITFIYLVIMYRQLPPFVPIFNQLTWGVDRLGGKVMIFFPLSINVGLIFINLLFSQGIYEKMPLVVRMLSITTLLIGFIFTIFVIRTTLLVI